MVEMTRTHFIGIDGGGTGCRVAIAVSSGEVIGRGESGAANATTDMDATIRHILDALAEAADDAGLPEPELANAVAHAGVAGVLSDEQSQKIEDAMPMATTVTEDCVTALHGALGKRDGILISLGTGTLIGQSRKGHQSFIGGWGLKLSDQASAGWLGKTLLSEVLMIHDGLAPPTALSRDVMHQFGGDPKAIVTFAAAAAPSELAALAPKVTEAAGKSDPLALSLMQTAATYLSDAIDTLGLGRKEVLCLTGGLGPRYTNWLLPNHRKHLADPEGNALDGALRLAFEAGAS